MKIQKKVLYVRLPEDVYYVVKDLAYLQQVSISKVIEDAVVEYLRNFYTEEDIEAEGHQETIEIDVPQV